MTDSQVTSRLRRSRPDRRTTAQKPTDFIGPRTAPLSEKGPRRFLNQFSRSPRLRADSVCAASSRSVRGQIGVRFDDKSDAAAPIPLVRVPATPDPGGPRDLRCSAFVRRHPCRATGMRASARWSTQHLNSVAQTLRRAGVPSSDLDDEIQRTFIVAAKRIDDVQVGAERSFLIQVAQNLASHARRKLARRREVLDGNPPERIEAIATPEFLAGRKQMRQLFDDVIGSLHESLRAVFTLFELEEMSMSDIAETLGLPRGTVASRLRRARAQFRQHVACPRAWGHAAGRGHLVGRRADAVAARADGHPPARAAGRRRAGAYLGLDLREDARGARIGRSGGRSLMLQAVASVRHARRSRPVMGDRENARLVAALRAQDPAVARPLFKRFAPTISRLLRRTLGPQAPIDVAVDVVLLCVFHRARRLQPRSDLRQFIVGATARVARAELRQPARPRFLSPRGWRAARRARAGGHRPGAPCRHPFLPNPRSAERRRSDRLRVSLRRGSGGPGRRRRAGQHHGRDQAPAGTGAAHGP